MLARPLHSLPVRLARSLQTHALTPLDRLSLDIHAAANRDTQFATPADAVTRAPAAVRGESLKGDVQLPRELLEAVDRAVESELAQLLSGFVK